MVTTLGFSIRVELAHHCQGQLPIVLLVRLFSMSFTPTNPFIQYRRGQKFRQRNQTQSHVENDRLIFMPISFLHSFDAIFPYFVFFYGAFITFVLEIPVIRDLAAKQETYAFQQLLMRREFALTCLIVGCLWTLQNMWLV